MAEPTADAPEKPAGIDLADLIRNYNAVQAMAGQSLQDLDGVIARAEAAAGAPAAAAKTVAAAQIEINNVVERAAIKKKTDDSQAAAAFGTNPDAQTYLIPKLGEQFRKGLEEEARRRQSVQESLDTGFFDDPLAWLAAQVSLPFEQAALEMTAATNDRLLTKLSNLQTLTLEQGKINAAVNEASSTELLAAKNKLALAGAAAAAAASQASLARLGIDKLNLRRALTGDQFSATIQALDVINRVQRDDIQKRELELREDSNRRANESHTQQMRINEVNLGVKQEQEEAIASLQRELNKATALVGMDPVPAKIFAGMPESNPIKRALMPLIYGPDVAFGRLGSSPVEVVDRLRPLPLQLPGQREIVRQGINAAISTVISNNQVTWKSMGADVRDELLLKGVKDWSNNQLANIPDSGSIYSPPPLTSVLSMPVYQGNPLAEKLRVLATNSLYPTKAEDVVNAGLELIRENTQQGKPDARLVAAVAGNIAFLYQGIMGDNNLQRAYNMFALPGLSTDYTGFKATVSTGSMLTGRTAVVDMSNATALTAFLIRRIAAEQMTGMIGEGLARNANPFTPQSAAPKNR